MRWVIFLVCNVTLLSAVGWSQYRGLNHDALRHWYAERPLVKASSRQSRYMNAGRSVRRTGRRTSHK